MDLKVYEKENVTVVEIPERLDANTADAIQDKLLESIKPSSYMVVDMAKCDYISSMGLRVLVILAKTLNAQKCKGALSSVSQKIEDIMTITGFNTFLVLYRSIDEAIKKLKSGDADNSISIPGANLKKV